MAYQFNKLPDGTVQVTGEGMSGAGTESWAKQYGYGAPAPVVEAPRPAPTPVSPTQTPTDPIAEYYKNLNTHAPTVDEQEAIRERVRKQMQGALDVVNQEIAVKRRRAEEQGDIALAQTRGSNVRAGLAGSDFGSANKQKVRDATTQVLDTYEEERTVRINEVLGRIDQRASQEIEAKQQEALGNREQLIKHLGEARTQAREDLKSLAATNVDLDKLKQDPHYQQLLNEAGLPPILFDAVFNANKDAREKVEYQYHNLGDGQVLRTGKRADGIAVKEEIFDYALPEGKETQLVMTPDGTPLVFNKATGEATVAPGFEQGAFAKPDTPETFTLGEGEKRFDASGKLLAYGGPKTYAPKDTSDIDGSNLNSKDRAVFNTLVDKANKSPLIAAADRSTILQGAIDAVKKDPSNGTLQLNLAYSYIQALDTYQSAVREGELSLVNSIDSKAGQWKNSAEQIINGQIVRPEVAKQIADAADQVVKTIKSGAQNADKKFEAQAKVNGTAVYNAWKDYRGGFEASYDVPTGGNPQAELDDDIQQLGGQYSSREQLIAALKSAYPELTPDQIASRVYALMPDKAQGGLLGGQTIKLK